MTEASGDEMTHALILSDIDVAMLRGRGDDVIGLTNDGAAVSKLLCGFAKGHGTPEDAIGTDMVVLKSTDGECFVVHKGVFDSLRKCPKAIIRVDAAVGRRVGWIDGACFVACIVAVAAAMIADSAAVESATHAAFAVERCGRCGFRWPWT